MTTQEINTNEMTDSSYVTAHSSESSDSENEKTYNSQVTRKCKKCNKDLNFDLSEPRSRKYFLKKLKEAIGKIVPTRELTITPIKTLKNMSRNSLPSLDNIMESHSLVKKLINSEKEKITKEVKNYENLTKKTEIQTIKPIKVNAKTESIFQKSSKSTVQSKNVQNKVLPKVVPKVLPKVILKKKQPSPAPNKKTIIKKKQVDNKTQAIKYSTNSLVGPGNRPKKTLPPKKTVKKKIGENSGMPKLKLKPKTVDKNKNVKDKKPIIPKRVSFQPNMVEVVSYVEETSKDTIPQVSTPAKEKPIPYSENPQPKKVRIDSVTMTPERAETIKNFYKSIAKKSKNEHIKLEKKFLAVKKLELSNDFN